MGFLSNVICKLGTKQIVQRYSVRSVLEAPSNSAKGSGFAVGGNNTNSSFSAPQLLINCLRNNIFLCLSTTPGKIIFSISSGQAGFPGTQKTSAKAALGMLDTVAGKLAELGIDQVRLDFRGLNPARPVIVGQLRKMGIKITEVMDSTGVPHNGCRPPKKRRL